MKLSFVIPAHNEEQYIGKCLDSVFSAIGNDPDIEVIVVNNGSTDGTRDVVRRYPSVTLIDEPQRGANRARQAGYRAARAELIASIDADTLPTAAWIAHALNEFTHDKKLVCISGPFIYYDLPWGINFFVYSFFYPIALLTYWISKFVLRRGAVIQGGNVVVKKSALDSIGGFNTDLLFYGDDTDLAYRLHKVGKIKFTFGFPIRSSGRRLAKEGAFTMGIRYGGNYLSMALFKKPMHENEIDTHMPIPNDDGKLHYNPTNKIRELAIASVTMAIVFGIIFGGGFLGYYAIVRSGILNNFTVTQIKAEVHKINVKLQNLSDSIGN